MQAHSVATSSCLNLTLGGLHPSSGSINILRFVQRASIPPLLTLLALLLVRKSKNA